MVTVSEYSTVYGLEPGPKGVVVWLVFERSSRDNTRHRINTVQRDNQHPSQVQHQNFFLNISFFVHEVYEKIKWA